MGPYKFKSPGRKQTRRGQIVMSALPPKAAATVADRRVRFGPNADIPSVYENLPQARSVAHQISLLPPTMTTPNAIHS
jgi:hypothetical protein